MRRRWPSPSFRQRTERERMMMETIFKAYVYKNMVKDLAKFVTKNLKKMDFDRDDMLRRVRLSTYTPVKSTVPVGSLVLIGAAAATPGGLGLAARPVAKAWPQAHGKALA